MILSEEEKEDIRKKYKDSTSTEVLNHLKRHFPVNEIDWTINGVKPKMISVGEKSYWIEGNKKFLVNKISNVVEDVFPSLDKPTLRRTVKYYLDILK